MENDKNERALLRSNYFADMYYRQKDIRKVAYYEKRIKDLKNEELYKNHGGERKYYENYYKNFKTNQ